jgi:hypothetical protein
MQQNQIVGRIVAAACTPAKMVDVPSASVSG